MKLFLKIFFGVFLGAIAAVVAMKIPGKLSEISAERQKQEVRDALAKLSPDLLIKRCGVPSADKVSSEKSAYYFRDITYGGVTFHFTSNPAHKDQKPDTSDPRQWFVEVVDLAGEPNQHIIVLEPCALKSSRLIEVKRP